MNLGGAIRINKCGFFLILGILFIILLYAYSGRHSNINTINDNLIWKTPGFNPGLYSNRISLKQLLIAAVDLAERGGLEVLAVKKESDSLGTQSKGKTKEGKDNPVTQGDFRSHRVMYYGFRKAFPKIKVISEEHTESPKDLSDIPYPKLENNEISKSLLGDEEVDPEDITIWVDPLDATQEYTENLVEYVTTMCCIAVKGVPIGGIIHFPFRKETYWSMVGFGSSPNLNKNVSNSSEKNTVQQNPYRIIVSRSHPGEIKKYIEDKLGGSEKDKNYQIIQAAGSGYKVMEIMLGKADVYLHTTHIKKWDLCAGSAILNGGNGKMLNLEGNTLDFGPDTDPVNEKGILAYTKMNSNLEKLQTGRSTT